jgi:hypothetical protein
MSVPIAASAAPEKSSDHETHRLRAGSGGKCPVRLPIGSALVDRICDHLSKSANESEWVRRLVEAGCNAGGNPNAAGAQPDFDTKGFRDRLLQSRLNSIDLFLERNPACQQLGKRAIAQELIPCETDDGLYPTEGPSVTKDWYRYLGDVEFLSHGLDWSTAPLIH